MYSELVHLLSHGGMQMEGAHKKGRQRGEDRVKYLQFFSLGKEKRGAHQHSLTSGD